MMIRRIGASALVAVFAIVATAHASTTNVIRTSETGPIGVIGLPVAQSFRPVAAGRVTSITVWPSSRASGEPGELTIHAGDRPGAELVRVPFVWTDGGTVVPIPRPVEVRAGRPYSLTVTGLHPQLVFGQLDPYPGGEASFLVGTGWRTWSEWNDCSAGGWCLPYVVDQRVVIQIEEHLDGDGDGVSDTDDRCADTVLPEPAVALLRPNRFAATTAGFVGNDGEIVASLAETGGCSAEQIVAARQLGQGLSRFGLTRPLLEGWIADVGG